MVLAVALVESPERRVDHRHPEVGGPGTVVAVHLQAVAKSLAMASPDVAVWATVLLRPWLHSLRQRQTWAWVPMQADSPALQGAVVEALLLQPRCVVWQLARAAQPFWLMHHVGCANVRPVCRVKPVVVLLDWRGVPWALGAQGPLLQGAGQLVWHATQVGGLMPLRGARLEVARPCGSRWTFLAGLFDRAPDPVLALPVPVRQCQAARANCACLGPWCCPGPFNPYAPSHILDRPQAENP